MKPLSEATILEILQAFAAYEPEEEEQETGDEVGDVS